MAKGSRTKEFKSSVGNPFTFQKVGAAEWLDIMDGVEVNGAPKRTKLYPAILESVVVKPQMKVKDFDDEPYEGYAELEEVATAALRFQQGKQ